MCVGPTADSPLRFSDNGGMWGGHMSHDLRIIYSVIYCTDCDINYLSVYFFISPYACMDILDRCVCDICLVYVSDSKHHHHHHRIFD